MKRTNLLAKENSQLTRPLISFNEGKKRKQPWKLQSKTSTTSQETTSSLCTSRILKQTLFKQLMQLKS
ncbi:hypothetical protein OIU84_002530 [Salix udensis]|uniref:Uncharacterized protein n=1 Tax=Salix udensis TaxID=889485 RepID=A0AAD6K4F2_9ROSI|nr:hypothetical protein OIU84_002530 [Salix udensis]